jgi:hypothetical protein
LPKTCHVTGNYAECSVLHNTIPDDSDNTDSYTQENTIPNG